jgi:hypothetical protein
VVSEIAALNTVTESLAPDAPPTVPPKTIVPPDWLGWALASVGSVLILNSLLMKKPGG